MRGLYQFNVTMPEVDGGDQAVEAEMGGCMSLGERLLAVER